MRRHVRETRLRNKRQWSAQLTIVDGDVTSVDSLGYVALAPAVPSSALVAE